MTSVSHFIDLNATYSASIPYPNPLTECPRVRETHGEGPSLRFGRNLGGLTHPWVGFTSQKIFGLGPAHMGGAAPCPFPDLLTKSKS